LKKRLDQGLMGNSEFCRKGEVKTPSKGEDGSRVESPLDVVAGRLGRYREVKKRKRGPGGRS